MHFGTIWAVLAPKKMHPKKFLYGKRIFPYIIHVKPKWNIIYKYLKTKCFSRDSNILPQMHWTLHIFGHSVTINGGFGVSLNYPILNFKKTVCPKNVWMRHWLFYKINTCLLKTTTCIGLQAEQIFSVNI